MDAYIGRPQEITHDAGRQFTAKEFQSNAAMVAIKCNTDPVESHGTVGMVERYHAPLRRAWNVIELDIPARNETQRSANLQASVKAVNDSAGPNGLVPILLIFGAMPRLGLSHDAATETITRRAAAVRRAMNELNRLKSYRQVQDALHTTNGPKTDDIKDFPLGGQVLVYREGKGAGKASWKGSFQMIGIDGEACLANLGNTASWFHTTHVRPYVLESANTQSQDKDKAFPTGPQQGKDDVSPFRLEMQIPRRGARLPDK